MAHITIGTDPTRIDAVASASQTNFNVPFEYFDEDDLDVFQNGTQLTITTDYTVTNTTTSDGGFSGGTVILTTGATLDDDIAIVLNMAVERTTDFPLAGDFDIQTLNTTLDKGFVIDKQQDEQISRAIIGPASESFSGTMPVAASRASKILGFSSDGLSISMVATDSLSIATLAGFTNNNTEFFSGDAAEVNFTLAADPVVIDNISVYLDGVRQKPGASYDFTLAGLIITFTTAPAVGTDNIMVTYGQAISTPATFADGTFDTPAIRFTDDSDNGFYRIGANNVGFTIAGAKLLDFSETSGTSEALTITRKTGAIELDPGTDTLDLKNVRMVQDFVAETLGAGIAQGQLCYLDNNGEMNPSDASVETTADTLLGLALEAVSAGQSGEFLLYGKYSETDLVSNVGAIYYVSETEGEIALAKPVTSSAVVRSVGYSLNATVLFFDPDRSYIVNA